MYQLFHAGAVSSDVRKMKLAVDDDDGWGSTGKDRGYIFQLAKALGQMPPKDRDLFFAMARKIAKRK
jgi:hypothetical protein